MEILVINFTLEGMTESDYRGICDQIAPAFAAVPGLVSKVWLADRANGVYGGVYTFTDGDAVAAFMGSELFAQAPSLSRSKNSPKPSTGASWADPRRGPTGDALDDHHRSRRRRTAV